MLHSQLTRQGMECENAYPKDKGYDGVVHIIVSPIDRSFSFLTETTYDYPRTLCYSVTEVLKRTWNTWVDPITIVSEINFSYPLGEIETPEITLIFKDGSTYVCTDAECAVVSKHLVSLMQQGNTQ